MEAINQLRTKFKEERQQSEQDQIRARNSLPSYLGLPQAQPEPDRYPIHLMLTEEQYKLMEEALDLLKKQSEGYRQRAINHPSETIKSTNTIARQRHRIEELDDILSRLSENAW